MGTVKGQCQAIGCPNQAVGDGPSCGALVCRLRVRWQEHASAEGIDESLATLARAQAVLHEAARSFAVADARPRAFAGDGSPLSEGERERRLVALANAANAFEAAEIAARAVKAPEPVDDWTEVACRSRAAGAK